MNNMLYGYGRARDGLARERRLWLQQGGVSIAVRTPPTRDPSGPRVLFCVFLFEFFGLYFFIESLSTLPS